MAYKMKTVVRAGKKQRRRIKTGGAKSPARVRAGKKAARKARPKLKATARKKARSMKKR